MTSRNRVLIVSFLSMISAVLFLASALDVYRYTQEIQEEQSRSLATQEEIHNKLQASRAFWKQTLLQKEDEVQGLASRVSNLETKEKEISEALLKNMSEKERAERDLQKALKVDVELLAKYSKNYFLNEHYVPKAVVSIPTNYTIQGRQIEIHKGVSPFLLRMLQDAHKAGAPLYVVSGYRSFESQKQLKSLYIQKNGKQEADTFSADQGFSEHQLGTTVDVSSDQNLETAATIAFEKSTSFAWLQKNAHRYGFILSYPKNNTYYIYEPWHYRFVGVELATWLYKNNLHFSLVSQRVLDTYVTKLFDN